MVNLYHNVSYQVWNDQNYQKLLKAQYHNKTKNKYFAEQGPPDQTNDVFPMKTLSQKRYILVGTPLLFPFHVEPGQKWSKLSKIVKR